MSGNDITDIWVDEWPQPTEPTRHFVRQPHSRLHCNWFTNRERKRVKDETKRKAKRKLQRKARKGNRK